MAFVRELVIFFMLVSAIQACQFSRFCTEITFSGNVMRANCRTSVGEVLLASINVNNCVGSSNGVLDCSSNFVRQCRNVTFDGLTMAARCNRGDGVYVFSNRALDDCIQSVEGVLQCY